MPTDDAAELEKAIRQLLESDEWEGFVHSDSARAIRYVHGRKQAMVLLGDSATAGFFVRLHESPDSGGFGEPVREVDEGVANREDALEAFSEWAHEMEEKYGTE